MALECKFCKKTFTTKNILLRHQKKAKYCLKIQKNLENNWSCQGCNLKFDDEKCYKSHILQCKDYIIEELRKEVKDLRDQLANVAIEHAKRPTNITNNNLNITQNIINNLNVYDISQIEANTENLTIDDISNGKKAAQYALENTFGNMLFNTDVNRGPLKALDCDRKIRNVDHDELTRDFFGGIKDKAREITKEEVEKRREEMKEKYKDCPYVNTNMDKKIDEMADNLGMIVGASKGRINKISREFKKEIYSQTNIKNLK